MVFSGFNTACRLASWPTSRSPVLVKPTTEGVRRLPSLLIITVGLPPSITETTELVVPRSIPIAFAIASSHRFFRVRPAHAAFHPNASARREDQEQMPARYL